MPDIFNLIDLIKRIEIFLIDKTLQPLARLSQRNLGLDCFNLAKIAMVVSIVVQSFGLWVAIGHLRLLLKYGKGSAFTTFLFLGILTATFVISILFFKKNGEYSLIKKKKAGYDAVERGACNPYMIMGRKCLFFLLVYLYKQITQLIHGESWYLGFQGAFQLETYWVAVALSCCTPDHPSRSWRKKDKAVEMAPAESHPIPSPIPAEA